MTSTTATPETPGAHGADPDGRPAIREGATGSAALAQCRMSSRPTTAISVAVMVAISDSFPSRNA